MKENDTPSNKPRMTLEFEARNLLRPGKGKTRGRDNNEENREPGRVPRITRLMALAIHLQKLIDNRAVRDYAEIARLASLTRARVTQIMNLTLLAPEIQEKILFLPCIHNGHDPLAERNLRQIIRETDWAVQMELWSKYFPPSS